MQRSPKSKMFALLFQNNYSEASRMASLSWLEVQVECEKEKEKELEDDDYRSSKMSRRCEGNGNDEENEKKLGC